MLFELCVMFPPFGVVLLQAAKVLAVGRHMALSSAKKVSRWMGQSLGGP